MNQARRHLARAGIALAFLTTLGLTWACGGEAPAPGMPGLGVAPAEQTPAAPAAAGSPACVKDTDCKGDRICNAGTCVAPH